jgi:hypothetical protein
VRLPLPAVRLVDALVPRGFLAGVPMSRFAGAFRAGTAEAAPAGPATDGVADGPGASGREAAPEGPAARLDDVLLLAVTERRTRAQIDAFVDAVAGVLAAHAQAGDEAPAASEGEPAEEEVDRV